MTGQRALCISASPVLPSSTRAAAPPARADHQTCRETSISASGGEPAGTIIQFA
jgi:hypothetical protein